MSRSKAAGDTMINLDSLLDIMTCLVGVLMMIIIMTGIDAAQIKVLINTPMDHFTDKRPVFIECRNNQLFLVPLEEINEMADEELRQIAVAETADHLNIFRKASASSRVKTDYYRADLSSSLLGQTVLTPIDNVSGYPLADLYKNRQDDYSETTEGWYGRILHSLNKENQMLTFLVRDDSFQVFKIARALAWIKRIDVGYELLASGEPIQFGLFGHQVPAE